MSFAGGFNFRVGTYNVPSGSSASSLTTRPKAEFVGVGWDGNQKCPSMSFILLKNFNMYIYLYTKNLSPTFLWVSFDGTDGTVIKSVLQFSSQFVGI